MPPMTGAAEADLAESRCRAYALFGTFALDGLTREVVDVVDAVPPLAAALDGFREGGALDADAVAAACFDAFSHQVFPFRSVFVSVEAQPGGPATERAAAFYGRAGFCTATTGPSADHVGWLLRAMSHLCGAEADAHRDGRADVVRSIRVLQGELLDDHLLDWWPALAEAAASAGFALHAPWAEAVTQLILHHRQTLERGGLQGSLPVALDSGPPLDALVERPQTGLADIASALLRPAQAGAFVSRGALRQAGRQQRVPAGFGARRTVLLNLLRGAATYAVFDRFTAQLAARFARARAFYGKYTRDAPRAAVVRAEPWVERCVHTERALAALKMPADG